MFYYYCQWDAELVIRLEKNCTDIKAKDKKLESVENVRRDSQQIGHSVKGTEVSIFSLFP